jgi:hypothetical protein
MSVRTWIPFGWSILVFLCRLIVNFHGDKDAELVLFTNKDYSIKLVRDVFASEDAPEKIDIPKKD